jgi:hypothetical protein
MDLDYERLNGASVVSWLLGVDEEGESFEVVEGLEMYFIGRIHGWTHVAALESTPRNSPSNSET